MHAQRNATRSNQIPPTSDEPAVIIRTLTNLVEPLAALLPGECEVVLYDLRHMPNSIVAIAGNLTGRGVGSSAAELLSQARSEQGFGTTLGHAVTGPDGKELRGNTLIFRDAQDAAVAALCILNDTQSWQLVADLARSMLPWTRHEQIAGAGASAEPTRGNVEDVAQSVLYGAIRAVGVPVDLMQKQHKLTVVRTLQDSGFFSLKESAETAAQALGVTRFSIYNYLNELDQDSVS